MSIQSLPGRQQKSREDGLNKPFIKTVEKLAPELNKLKRIKQNLDSCKLLKMKIRGNKWKQKI